MPRRTAVALVVAPLLLAVAFLVAMAHGRVDVSFTDVARAIGGARDMPSWVPVVLFEIRLPRVLLAALVGAGLAVAGATMQAIFRNPMADPGVIGVSAGAALFAVTMLYVLPATLSTVSVPIGAFAGALGCAALVYGLATRGGRTPVTTLLLAGLAVSAVAGALTSFVLSLAVADWEVGRQMLAWLMGGVDGRSFAHVLVASPIVLGGAIGIAFHARELDAFLLGEEAALSVGVDVGRTRRDLLLLSSLVTAATVAVAGVIGFVGLLVPHVARLLVGPRHAVLLPFAAIVGAIAVVVADLGTRTLPASDLRLGVVTSLVGGPFFLFLLTRHRAFGAKE